MGGLVDVHAALIVIGGSLIIALLRCRPAAARRALAALPLLHRADPDADAQAATLAAGRLEALARIKDIACADRVETAGRYLRRALHALSQARTAAAFAAWADADLHARRRRHGEAIGFWRGLADAAPAAGMIGTVLGLVSMFGAMDDPAALGPAMATALLATLYGLLLANVVAGPISDRLEALSEAELAWQERLLARLHAVAEAELAPSRPRLAA